MQKCTNSRVNFMKHILAQKNKYLVLKFMLKIALAFYFYPALK